MPLVLLHEAPGHPSSQRSRSSTLPLRPGYACHAQFIRLSLYLLTGSQSHAGIRPPATASVSSGCLLRSQPGRRSGSAAAEARQGRVRQWPSRPHLRHADLPGCNRPLLRAVRRPAVRRRAGNRRGSFPVGPAGPQRADGGRANPVAAARGSCQPAGGDSAARRRRRGRCCWRGGGGGGRKCGRGGGGAAGGVLLVNNKVCTSAGFKSWGLSAQRVCLPVTAYAALPCWSRMHQIDLKDALSLLSSGLHFS